MDMLLYSDLHLREEREDDCLYVLDQIKRIAIERNIVRILNGGDTFNTRGIIRTRLIHNLYLKYKEWAEAGLIQYILVGNHDQEDKAGKIHPMKIFEEFDNWRVIDEPYIPVGEKLAFFPYIEQSKVSEALNGRSWKGYTAFVHWGICGASRNDSNIDDDGIPQNWLSGFKAVFSGHYHYRSKLGHINYIGSPLQQSFGEMGHDKGVLILDTEKNKYEFVPIQGTPKHHEIKVFWENGKAKVTKPKGIGPNDFVRARVIGDAEQVSKMDRHSLEKSIKCRSIKIEREVQDKSVSRLNIDSKEIYNTESLMGKYVDFVNTDLNRKKLLKLGKEIVNAPL